MNIEEAENMNGTEFTYVLKDGDSVPAYVKKFDHNVGLTCLSLDTKTVQGWAPSIDSKALEADGTFCVIGASITSPRDLRMCLRILSIIQEYRMYTEGTVTPYTPGTISRGFQGCAFSNK